MVHNSEYKQIYLQTAKIKILFLVSRDSTDSEVQLIEIWII